MQDGRRIPKLLLLALPLVVVLLLVTAAAGEARAPRQTGSNDCQECHEEVVLEWEESEHADAYHDEVFRSAWKGQDSPRVCLTCHTTGFDTASGEWDAEGVACAACHGPYPADHPNDIMPAPTSASACGDCHLDTYADWQNSSHGESTLSCVSCHNPHMTTLKVVDSQELCRGCHSEETHFFGMTTHAEAGLLCTDCHLRIANAPAGEGHAQRLHTFTVDLQSCVQCHGEDMHYPVENTNPTAASALLESGRVSPQEPPAVTDTTMLADSPDPINPINYVLVAVVGAGLVISLAPTVRERYGRRQERS